MAKKPPAHGPGSSMRMRVRVQAGAKHEHVERIGTSFKISVKEPPQGNRANMRVREILARELMAPLAAIRLVSGHHRPSKIFEIKNG